MAIYVHVTVPCATDYNHVIRDKNGMEPCATLLYPNRTMENALLIAGIYRPPEEERPPYAAAYKKMLLKNDEQRTTSILMSVPPTGR